MYLLTQVHLEPGPASSIERASTYLSSGPLEVNSARRQKRINGMSFAWGNSTISFATFEMVIASSAGQKADLIHY